MIVGEGSPFRFEPKWPKETFDKGRRDLEKYTRAWEALGRPIWKIFVPISTV